MADEKVKNQHYVPQFYLRYFSNRKEQIQVFDKFSQRTFSPSVKNIAAETFFYDFPKNLVDKYLGDTEIEGLDLEEQLIESFLSDLETQFSALFRRIVALYTLSSIESLQVKQTLEPYRGHLALFVTTQFFRSKQWRESYIEMYEKSYLALAQKIGKITGTIPEWPDNLKVEFNRELASIQHAQFLVDPDIITEFTGIFMSHYWTIGINITDQPLYTSDHPVVKKGHLKSNFFSNTGFASPGIEIAVPLTPKLILIMYERSYFKAASIQDNRFVLLNEDNITYYNSLQVYQSYRQVYAPSGNFGLVKAMIKKEPNLTKPLERFNAT